MSVERYYRFHARIYDATRWSFLFGRRGLLERVSERLDPLNVLEVGCGTGTNLRYLAKRFDRARFVGVDLSADMLDKARSKLAEFDSRVELIQGYYPSCLPPERKFDLIVFSYALTMFDDEYLPAMKAAQASLTDEGTIAIVDFHDAVLPGFKKWMKLNHVRVEAHILPALEQLFRPRGVSLRPAFLGAWSYFTFIGQKPRPNAPPLL